MPPVEERVVLTISAKNLASSVLRDIKDDVMRLVTVYAGWEGAKMLASKIVTANAEAEVSTVKLANAVGRSRQIWESVRGPLDDYSRRVQMVTEYSDGLVKSGLARLINYGFSVSEAMRAMSVATDLAAARDMDLSQAVDILARAHAGSTGMLERYVGTVRTATGASATFNDLLDKTQRMFGGEAQANMNTMIGRWKELQNVLSNFLDQANIKDITRTGLALISQYLRELPQIIENSGAMFSSWLDIVTATFNSAGLIVKQFGDLMRSAVTFRFDELDVQWEKLQTAVEASMLMMKIALGNAGRGTSTWYNNTMAALNMIILQGAVAAKSSVVGVHDVIKQQIQISQADLWEWVKDIQRLQMQQFFWRPPDTTKEDQALQQNLEEQFAEIEAESQQAAINVQQNISNATRQAWTEANSRMAAILQRGREIGEMLANRYLTPALFRGIIQGGEQARLALQALRDQIIDTLINLGVKAIATYVAQQVLMHGFTLTQAAANALETASVVTLTEAYIALNSVKAALSLGATVGPSLAAAAAEQAGLKAIIGAGKLIPVGHDDPVNDALAFKHGRDYAAFFLEGFRSGTSAPGFGQNANRNMDQSGLLANAGQAGSQVNINFYGTVTSAEYARRELSPVLAKLASRAANQLKLETFNMTGNKIGYFG